MLGDDVEAFSGSQADLEGAAESLFSSPPHPQPLRFESLKTPQTVPPTPGTALQHKIESRLEKSLGSQFNIQLQQQMEVFQVSMLEAMKSLRDEMHSMKKASESDVVQTSDTLPKAEPSKQPDSIATRTSISTTWASDHSDAQPMDRDHYGPPLPPKSTQSLSMLPGTLVLNPTTRTIILSRNNIKRCVQKPKNILTKGSTRYGQSINLSHLLQRKMNPLSQLKSLQNLNKRLLPSLNFRLTQIQSSTGRWTCPTSLDNMLRKWKLLCKIWISLIPGHLA